MIPWLLIFMLIFGFSNVAFGGGGGPEDPYPCPAGTPEDPLPEPNAGKFLRGEFTAARYLDTFFGIKFSVHIYLKKGKQEHLFSFLANNVLDVCALTDDDLIETFKTAPCKAGADIAFELEGIPVISYLKILQKEQCETDSAMIRGEIDVRVVPYDVGDDDDDDD
jgi:hypothetical protein